jgi:hypothetical protein
MHVTLRIAALTLCLIAFAPEFAGAQYRSSYCRAAARRLRGSTQTTSLDTVRNQYLEAQLDYQECVNASGGEINNPCASKRVIAEGAERAYRDAMSKGLQGSR